MPIDTNVTITPQNLVDYYKEFVVDSANANIAWGTNNFPFSDWPSNTILGGNTAGRSIGITGSNISTAGNLIDASDILDVLTAETANYYMIRNLRAILFVEGGGGNTGSRGAAGTVFDETRKAHMNSNYVQAQGTILNGGVVQGDRITASTLESFFANLKADFEAKQGQAVAYTVSVCHASCHSSCHGSRGRR